MQTKCEFQLRHPVSAEAYPLSASLVLATAASPKTEKRKLVIMMHGWGADGADLSALAPHLTSHLEQCAFFFPDAPFPCSANPFGREWFELNSSDIQSDEIANNCSASRWILHQMIQGCVTDLGYAAEEIWVGGFSQGGMMACDGGLSYSDQLGGIFCLSGGLLGEVEKNQSVHTPILLCHGEADMVVSPLIFQQTEAKLTQAGFNPTTHLVSGLGHGIDHMVLTHLLSFLR